MDFTTQKNLILFVLFLSPCGILSALLSVGVFLKGIIKNESQRYLYIWKSYIYAISIQIAIICLMLLAFFIMYKIGHEINDIYGLLALLGVFISCILTIILYIFFLFKLKPNNTFKTD